MLDNIKSVNIETIISYLLIFTLSVTAGIFVYIVMIGMVNDYAVQNFYDLAILLENQGQLTNTSSGIILDINTNTNTAISFADNIFFAAYVSFSILLFIAAYFSRKMSVFKFNNLIYVGMLVVLFILDFLYQIQLWFYDNFIEGVFSLADSTFPKLVFFISHMGIIITAQIIICIMLNILDFDVIANAFRKRKEDEVLKSDEVL